MNLPSAPNPSIHPRFTAELQARLTSQREAVLAMLSAATQEFTDRIVFANSLGAEDMVLTDIIASAGLGIAIFSLDTGRLPEATYDLIARTEAHYGIKIQLYFPQASAVEAYASQHGINGFYSSVALRKACCAMRKVEPLKRALAGQQAWISGMRAQQSITRQEVVAREFDSAFGLEKFNPLRDWSETEVWAYIHHYKVPYNALHEQFYPSIGCAPCTRAVALGEDIRAGRWWWEDALSKECGLHSQSATH